MHSWFSVLERKNLLYLRTNSGKEQGKREIFSHQSSSRCFSFQRVRVRMEANIPFPPSFNWRDTFQISAVQLLSNHRNRAHFTAKEINARIRFACVLRRREKWIQTVSRPTPKYFASCFWFFFRGFCSTLSFGPSIGFSFPESKNYFWQPLRELRHLHRNVLYLNPGPNNSWDKWSKHSFENGRNDAVKMRFSPPKLRRLFLQPRPRFIHDPIQGIFCCHFFPQSTLRIRTQKFKPCIICSIFPCRCVLFAPSKTLCS